jgi:localization factor PodJL
MTSIADRLQALEDSDAPAPTREFPAIEPPTLVEATPTPFNTEQETPWDATPEAPPSVLLHDDLGELAPPPLADDEPDLFPWDQDLADPTPVAEVKAKAPNPKDTPIAPPSTEVAATPPAKKETPAKNDYLSAARRAAQTAGAAPRSKGEPKPAKADASALGASDRATPAPGLRGLNKVVLRSAGGALAVAIGMAGYMLLPDEPPKTSAKAEPKTPTGTATSAPQEIIAAPVVETATTTTPDDGLASDSIDDAAPRAKASSQSPPPEPEAKAQKTSETEAGVGSITLEAAATKGDAVAQYDLGLQRIAAGNSQEGLSLLRRAANQGLAMAQYRLAKLYERGEGVPTDLAQAKLWTERAAAAGNRKAMHDLGVFFARGEGAPFDETAAFRWFRQAADLGVADSQFNLGVLYQQGRGAEQNLTEAYHWYLVAARGGDADAKSHAAGLETQLGPERAGVIKTRAEAFRPKTASARANGDFGERVWAVNSPKKDSSRS